MFFSPALWSAYSGTQRVGAMTVEGCWLRVEGDEKEVSPESFRGSSQESEARMGTEKGGNGEGGLTANHTNHAKSGGLGLNDAAGGGRDGEGVAAGGFLQFYG